MASASAAGFHMSRATMYYGGPVFPDGSIVRAIIVRAILEIERIDDPDSPEILSIVHVLGINGAAAGFGGGSQDGGIPLGQGRSMGVFIRQ